MPPTANRKLLAWVEEVAALTAADRVEWCDGSDAEYERLCQLLVDNGTFTRLSQAKRPDSYWARSDPGDVARVEDRTFICSKNEDDAGPTNNWRDPDEMRATLTELFKGSMRGRTMYVVPFSMGPLGSPIAHIGVEITDSPYVVVSMRIMTRMGTGALEVLGDDGEFVPCLHSVGYPARARPGRRAVAVRRRAQVHRALPRDRARSGRTARATAATPCLGKKCFALRIASVMARDDHWLAEHMLILKLTSPEGDVRYVTGAFPSACGKTNLAMLVPTIPGWKVETIGDDICWMKFGADGRLYAINPEAGLLRGGPGDGHEDQPQRHGDDAQQLHLHQHGPHRRRRRVVGGHDRHAARAPHRLARRGLDAGRPTTPAAHPNARFTVPAQQNPACAPEWEDPEGVPISAILFGGRRRSVVPLVTESFDWAHGVFLGSILSSETTAAAAGAVGNLRRDPFAMLPFCGYNMADYFAHWLRIGKSTDAANLPRIYYVNWFRKDADGRFLWPGFGENSRVLAWIVERTAGQGRGDGRPPSATSPPRAPSTPTGSGCPDSDMAELLRVDADEWRHEVPLIREHYARFGDRLPVGARRAARRPGAPARADRHGAAQGATQRWRSARRLVRYDKPVTAATAAITTSPAASGSVDHHRQQGTEHPHQLQPRLEAGEGPALGGGRDVALHQGVEGRLAGRAGHTDDEGQQRLDDDAAHDGDQRAGERHRPDGHGQHRRARSAPCAPGGRASPPRGRRPPSDASMKPYHPVGVAVAVQREGEQERQEPHQAPQDRHGRQGQDDLGMRVGARARGRRAASPRPRPS